MIKISEEEIIRGLLLRDEKAINLIYENYFPLIKRMVKRNFGNYENAEDVFQEALVIIYEKIKNNDFRLRCSFKTFLYSVCRNQWIKSMFKCGREYQDKFFDVEEYFVISHDVQDYELFDEIKIKEKLFHKYFLELSKNCQRILKLYFYGKTNSEITEIMRFKSEIYTRTRKYTCKETLKKKIFNNPEYKKILYNKTL